MAAFQQPQQQANVPADLATGAAILNSKQCGDKVAFPENWDKGVLYNTVDRYDVKQYRELWSTPAAVEAARKGEPIPSGTVLTLVLLLISLLSLSFLRERTPKEAKG